LPDLGDETFWSRQGAAVANPAWTNMKVVVAHTHVDICGLVVSTVLPMTLLLLRFACDAARRPTDGTSKGKSRQ
jgi:hypothetical protein